MSKLEKKVRRTFHLRRTKSFELGLHHAPDGELARIAREINNGGVVIMPNGARFWNESLNELDQMDQIEEILRTIGSSPRVIMSQLLNTGHEDMYDGLVEVEMVLTTPTINDVAVAQYLLNYECADVVRDIEMQDDVRQLLPLVARYRYQEKLKKATYLLGKGSDGDDANFIHCSTFMCDWVSIEKVRKESDLARLLPEVEGNVDLWLQCNQLVLDDDGMIVRFF